MTSETDNAPLEEGVTDNAENITDDTSEEWTYHDPDEDDLDNVDTVSEAETDDDEEEAEGEAEEAEPEAVVYADEKAKVKLPDGSEMPVAELIKGRMLQADYTRKTQEVANERKAVQADVERMQRITTAFVDHLSALVPDPPPADLLYRDPQKAFVQQQIHDRAMAQVHQLIEMGNAPKEISTGMNEADDKRQLQEANQRLIEMFPEAASGQTREAFFNGVQSVASQLGFSNADLSSIRDPRIFALAHWASKGMAADKAKATAKAKVAAAPPATPRKPGQGAKMANGNVEASKRFARNPSIRNAAAAWDGG